MRVSIITISAAIAVVTLTGCGGGGGGGGGGGPGTEGGIDPMVLPPEFCCWSGIDPDTPVEIRGSGQETAYTYDVVDEQVTFIEGFSDVGTIVTLTLDSNQEATRLVLNTSQTSITWDENTGDTIDDLGAAGFPQYVVVISNDEDDFLLAADPFELGWDYQSFGFWATGQTTSSRRFGTASIGNITASVPNIGTAVYMGELAGAYVAPDGSDFLAVADLQIDVDFVQSTLALNSSNTMLSDADFPPSNPADFMQDGTLDLSGTLFIGESGFTGELVNADGRLNGDATGFFYGPNAEELGGNFRLDNENDGFELETYAGAFGAKQ